MDDHFYNTLTDGDFGNGLHLMQSLTEGDFWTRGNGCITAYIGPAGEIDTTTIIAASNIADASMSVPIALPAGVYHVSRHQVSCCGLQSEAIGYYVLVVDDEGAVINAAPNPPIQLTATQSANGTIILRWRHVPGAVPATHFKIYIDTGSGFDFNTPLATVRRSPGSAGQQTYTSDPLTHGVMVRFVVRSYSSRTEGESSNTNHVAVTPDAIGPDVISGVTIAQEVIA